MQVQRSRTWIVTAACVIVVACVVAAVLVVSGSDSEPNAKDDCDVVTELLTQWRDEIGAAVQKLAAGTSGRDDTLALADKEAELAEKIRASTSEVESAEITRDLDQWATGADQLAQVHRDQITNPSPDVTAPPPAGYIQGSVAVNEATSSLVVACPSARPDAASN